jgi:DNA-binding protein HU-beta
MALANLVQASAHSPMNKSELIGKIAHDAKLSRGEAGEVVEMVLEQIIKSLQEGDDVRLSGFGVFSVVARDATRRRNPKTGKVMKVPPSKRVRFAAGKLLKMAVKSS